MAFGVLEDHNMTTVPGTVNLSDMDRTPGQELTGDVKRRGDIILVPQPSDSPDDPLNMSQWRKNLLIFILSLTSGVTVALGPMISPGLPLLATQFHKSLDVITTYLVGLFILWAGIITFFTSAAASVWGKRILFLTTTFALVVLNVWGFFISSFVPFVIMRLLQAFASAPLETLVTSTVQDIFFLHERGQKLAIWGIMITGGVLLGQVISGEIIQALGVSYTFGACAIIYAPLLIAMIFFVPETAYERQSPVKEIEWEEKGAIVSPFDEPARPSRSRLNFFQGRAPNVSFWGQVVKPLPLFVYPAVVFGSFVYGSFFTWLVTLNVLSVPIFSAPPYNLTPAQIGLTNLPLFFAGLIGSPISGWMADKVVRSLAKRNRGTYEPEFRLTLMLIASILSTTGLFGLGLSLQMGAPLAWPLFFQSLHSLAVPFSTQASYTYVTDCHPKDANQAFVTIGLVKAVLTFIVTTFVNGWYAAQGPRTVFSIIGAINLGVCSLTIPLYIFGKKFRSIVARKIDSKISH